MRFKPLIPMTTIADTTTPQLTRAPRRCRCARSRRGMVAVEAAVIMPFVVMLMLGVWEVGRMIQVQQIITNACREGARVAAGGTLNDVPVTVSMVQQQVQNYLTAAGLPSAAASGSQVTLTNLSANSWTDPCDAQPLDRFKVTCVIPTGAAYNSLRWGVLGTITGKTSMTVVVNWMSATNSALSVSSSLPY